MELPGRIDADNDATNIIVDFGEASSSLGARIKRLQMIEEKQPWRPHVSSMLLSLKEDAELCQLKVI